MSRLHSIIVAVVVALFVIASGLGAATVISGQHHPTTMNQNGGSCLTLCLNAAHIFDATIIGSVTAQLFVVLIGVSGVVLSFMFMGLRRTSYAYRPRPSPNLVELHAAYLE